MFLDTQPFFFFFLILTLQKSTFLVVCHTGSECALQKEVKAPNRKEMQ